MSWNKNTVNRSSIDTIISTLKRLNESYTVTVLGRVKGFGLNDDEGKTYMIRKLEYQDTVVLEQMLRTSDCDMDDSIISVEFNKSKEPKDWSIEATIEITRHGQEEDYEGDDDPWGESYGEPWEPETINDDHEDF